MTDPGDAVGLHEVGPVLHPDDAVGLRVRAARGIDTQHLGHVDAIRAVGGRGAAAASDRQECRGAENQGPKFHLFDPIGRPRY